MTYIKKKPQNPRGWNYDARRYFEVRDFYRKQIKKFEKLGFGKKTENGVEGTQSLIDITKKRDYMPIVIKLVFVFSYIVDRPPHNFF